MQKEIDYKDPNQTRIQDQTNSGAINNSQSGNWLAFINRALLILFLLSLGIFVEYRFQPLAQFATSSSIISNGSRTQLSRILESETPSQRENVSFGAFWEVWSLLERDYLEPERMDAEVMVDGAIYGLTSSLGDPYTMYLPKKEKERSGQDLAGAFYGVGIELGYVNGVLAAVSPLEGTPAFNAGVQAGDLILNVKDEAKGIDDDSTRWSLDKAVDVIRGPLGTPVTLTLYREGVEAPFDVTIIRGEIIVKSVQLEFVQHAGKRVAHIKLSRFGERTNGEWDSIVAEVVGQKNNIDGIVLDMRNNPGGYFDGAIDVASEFIQKGVVVTQKSRLTTQDFSVRGQARLSGIPVEVLVNRGSASASEIVAGALRDQLGAKLIGQRTFGKGTVQDRRELSNGGGIHITVARWMLPGGDWIHDEGIEVDIEVEQNPDTTEDEQLLRAIELI
jgi:carboxyl-terminal processing protease